MKRFIYIIVFVLSLITTSCGSSKGCGCPSPHGYINNITNANEYLAYNIDK